MDKYNFSNETAKDFIGNKKSMRPKNTPVVVDEGKNIVSADGSGIVFGPSYHPSQEKKSQIHYKK